MRKTGFVKVPFDPLCDFNQTILIYCHIVAKLGAKRHIIDHVQNLQMMLDVLGFRVILAGYLEKTFDAHIWWNRYPCALTFLSTNTKP